MAQKNQTKKKTTTARKAVEAKRGKRHTFKAPPAPKPPRNVWDDPYMVAATNRAKALMETWAA